MSDSDCSNCSNRLCPFKDYSYNCYKNSIEEVQKNMDSVDIEFFKQALNRANILQERTDNDVFYQVKRSLQEVIDMYNGE